MVTPLSSIPHCRFFHATQRSLVLARMSGWWHQNAACKGARPNHVGVVIARHKRAGRIEERDGKLYATQPAETAQRAAV